ncbi:MAG: dihydroxyacetone kinase subunit DhaL [bacterium]|nr:dihydroxyacetone kinase subunit DhaL [bacterium]
MDTLRKDTVITIMRALSELMQENKQYLIELDSVMGDGDLGLTMERAFGAGYAEIANDADTDIGKLLMKAGLAMARVAPSTMGTLVATGFMRGGKALAGKGEISAADLTAFFQAFVGGIMERGKAKPGEKTIIDSMHPAAEALAAAGDIDIRTAMEKALEAAEVGLEASKEMVARHGRVAYYGEQSKGKQDPGATVGVLIFRGFCSIWN